MSEAVYSTLQRMLSSRDPTMSKVASRSAEPQRVGIDTLKVANLCEKLAECLPFLEDDREHRERAVANATAHQKLAALHKVASSGQEGALTEVPLGPHGQLPLQIPVGGENEVDDMGMATSGLVPDLEPDLESPDEMIGDVETALETNQHLPAKIAHLKRKFAADANNPASIKASKRSTALETNLADVLGTGASVGPAELRSSEQMIDATKRDFSRTRADMRAWLSEATQSKSSDPVLHDAFEYTDDAGAKIAAARTLLRKWAEANPSNHAHMRDAILRVKLAAPIPGSSAGEVSDEALAAAARGVTPEQIAAAQLQLASQIVPPGAPMGGPPPGPPPGAPMGMPMGGAQPGMPMGMPPQGGMPPMM